MDHGEAPHQRRCGACLLVPTRSSFVTGTSAPPGDANREGTAFRGRYVTTSTSVRSLSHSVLISYTTSHEVRACYPLATSCNATRGSGMPFTRGCPPSSGRNARYEVYVTSYLTCSSRGWRGGSAFASLPQDDTCILLYRRMHQPGWHNIHLPQEGTPVR